MKLTAVRIYNYKCITDSGLVQIEDLSALVGKNEAGKTSLLKAIHKFKPFTLEPYEIETEWPRSRRGEKNDLSIVCECHFQLSSAEHKKLSDFNLKIDIPKDIIISRQYNGDYDIPFIFKLEETWLSKKNFEKNFNFKYSSKIITDINFKDRINEIKENLLIDLSPHLSSDEVDDLLGVYEDKISELNNLFTVESDEFSKSILNQFSKWINDLFSEFKKIDQNIDVLYDYLLAQIPTMIYFDDYKSFCGTAFIDQIYLRKNSGTLTEQDKTFIMILEIAGLNLDQEYEKATKQDKSIRQYDIKDASQRITTLVQNNWSQSKYKIEFNEDGYQFNTFIKFQDEESLIKLEEKSKGFQWFFSFDLLFMHESNGTYNNCVILLDEPGLHLHPDGQSDLLKVLNKYSKINTIIYSTHLPFMLDLRYPENIKVLNETKTGTVVSNQLDASNQDGKLTLEAALGMTCCTSYLVAKRNIIVEGVDDYWIITELSNLLIRSGKEGLASDILLTAGGGASKAVYIATFMIGQKLEVTNIFDSDTEGKQAGDELLKKWITKYNGKHSKIIYVDEILNLDKENNREIEDIFDDEYYLHFVKIVYGKEVNLLGDDSIINKITRELKKDKILFDKAKIAKRIREDLLKKKNINELSVFTQTNAQSLISILNKSFEK